MAAVGLLVLLVCLLNSTTGQDLCITASVMKDDGGRRPRCNLSYDKCDRYMSPGWYRLMLNTGADLMLKNTNNLMMPTFPVSVNSCGTRYPIWLNGSHPSEAEGIVDRTGCVSTNLNNCQVTYNIKIKNCTEYMVYYLNRAQGCNERYCFENTESSGVCSPPTTTTATTTTATTTTTTTTTPTATTTVPYKETRFDKTPHRKHDCVSSNSIAIILAVLVAVLCCVIVGLLCYIKVNISKCKVSDIYSTFGDLPSFTQTKTKPNM